MLARRWVSPSPTDSTLWMGALRPLLSQVIHPKGVDTELLFSECSCTHTLHMRGSTNVCVEVKGHSPVLVFKRHPPWVSFVVLCFWRPRRGVLLVCTLPSRLYYPVREPQKFSCPCLFSARITCVYHHTQHGFKGQTHVRMLARAFYHLRCLPRPKELSRPYN